MSDDELFNHAKGLLFKIHVITGWQIPDEKLYINILEDQLRKKLTEDYHDLNVDEIEYAFRSFGTVVKDWGKAMNLSLLDEVLISYRQSRRAISSMEESAAVKQIEYKPDIEKINAEYEAFLQTDLGKRLNPKL